MRAPGAELATHRLRAAPHLDHLGAALLHVADDHRAVDPLIVEERKRSRDGVGSGRVAEAVRDVDPEVPLGLRVRLGVDLGDVRRGLDVAVLVAQPQVADDVGPIVWQRLEQFGEFLGERSVLMVPVVSRGQSIGIIEAYRRDERAWTRAEVNRARVIANQFASVIPTLSGTEEPPARAERTP